MPHHSEKQFSKYSAQQLFELVADVEKYPEFLPWCRAARILDRKENEFTAELIIAFSHFSENYVSRVLLTPYSSIEVKLVRGPFEHLTNSWKFTKKDGKTEIDFWLDFKFRKKILEMLIGSLFAKATAKMVSAFQERADRLYH